MGYIIKRCGQGSRVKSRSGGFFFRFVCVFIVVFRQVRGKRGKLKTQVGALATHPPKNKNHKKKIRYKTLLSSKGRLTKKASGKAFAKLTLG